MARRAKGDIRSARDGINRAVHGGFHRLAARQEQTKPQAEPSPPPSEPAAMLHHSVILPDWPRASKRVVQGISIEVAESKRHGSRMMACHLGRAGLG